jgi:predicted ATPase
MDNLSHIKIKGFKSIKELDLEMQPINVLIGANGSGKSNFISVFRLLENIYTVVRKFLNIRQFFEHCASLNFRLYCWLFL